jgi:uncharacterized protein (AIM24 family)
MSRYTCEWCNTESDGSALSCPGCGAPTDIEAVESPSGWKEMPGIRDMARLEMGRSTCQIEGSYVPVADFNLAEGDSVYFTHHVMLWKDPQVPITTMSMANSWTRMLAGLPLVMTQASGPGHIAFSRDEPGEMLALPLHPGQAMDVREHVMLAATGNVGYDFFDSGIYFRTGSGKEEETHWPLGMFMDRFTARNTPGLVILHGAGNVLVRTLAENDSILVKPTAVLFKEPSVQMHLHVESPGGNWQASGATDQRYLWVRLYGPGRVAIQSAYKHFHDPGSAMSASSPLTRWRPAPDRSGRYRPSIGWHYLVGEKQKYGPMPLHRIVGYTILGKLPTAGLVWTDGLKDWVPLDTVGACARCGAEAPVKAQRFANVSWGAILFFVVCFPLLPFALLMWASRSRVCGQCGADVDLAATQSPFSTFTPGGQTSARRIIIRPRR